MVMVITFVTFFISPVEMLLIWLVRTFKFLHVRQPFCSITSAIPFSQAGRVCCGPHQLKVLQLIQSKERAFSTVAPILCHIFHPEVRWLSVFLDFMKRLETWLHHLVWGPQRRKLPCGWLASLFNFEL